ncbi:MAG: hypothetical protein J3K34DRAFT_456019 [Monoraphidium minutum]|nr:MAG: hypothetical protein J3K34DRAFT_456019 [Monoraphidium minutum]
MAFSTALILRAPGRTAEEDLLVARLCRGGVRAAAVDSLQDAAPLLREWGVPEGAAVAFVAGGSTDVCGGALEVLPWEQSESSTAAMQALVQLNRRRAPRGPSPQQQQKPGQEEPSSSSGSAAAEATHRAAAGAAGGGGGEPPLVVVGYAMKASREQQLADQGLLPLLPQPTSAAAAALDGGGGGGALVCFMPLDVSRPLDKQGAFDALLHKASDELVAGPGGGGPPAWSGAMVELRRQAEAARGLAVVDPFDAAAKVVDRAVLCAILSDLEGVPLPGGVRARAPRHAVAASLAAPDLGRQLEAAGTRCSGWVGAGCGLASCALLVKPIAACGVPGSHTMALALGAAALPALTGGGGGGGGGGFGGGAVVVQEFVNHGGLQYKAYAIADHVFYATRASIPDVARPGAAALAAAAAAAGGPAAERLALRFDSLASLPTALPPHMAAGGGATLQPSGGGAPAEAGGAAAAAAAAAPAAPPLHQGALEAVAGFLRGRLGLSLFGFDIVVCADTGEWLVVDVNYFPNYKGGPPQTAAWLRDAVAGALAAHRRRVGLAPL